MMTLVAAPAVRYHHVVGMRTSEAIALFTSDEKKYGVEVDDIDFDFEYCEAHCSSDQPLTPVQMSAIALSGDVCYLMLNSLEEIEEDAE